MALQLEGADKIRKALGALGADRGRQIVIDSSRFAMKAALVHTKQLVQAEGFDSGAWLATLGQQTFTLKKFGKIRTRDLVAMSRVIARGGNKRALAIYNAARAARGQKPVTGLFHFLLVDEYGFRGRPARHLMARALRRSQREVLRRFRRKLGEGLEREWQRRT